MYIYIFLFWLRRIYIYIHRACCSQNSKSSTYWYESKPFVHVDVKKVVVFVSQYFASHVLCSSCSKGEAMSCASCHSVYTDTAIVAIYALGYSS